MTNKTKGSKQSKFFKSVGLTLVFMYSLPYDVGYCAEYGLDVIYSMGE